MSRKLLAILIVLVLSFVTACQSNTSQLPTGTTSPNPNTALLASPGVSPMASPYTGYMASPNTERLSVPLTSPHPTPNTTINMMSLPSQINAIKGDSTEIINNIDKKNWKNAEKNLKELKANMSAVKPMLLSAKVSNNLINKTQAAINGLEKQIADKKAYASKVQANSVTRYLPDIADTYKAIIPTDLGRLDYLVREVKLNAEADNWTVAKNNYLKCTEIWSRLRGRLPGKIYSSGNPMNTSLNRLGVYINNKNGGNILSEANKVLSSSNRLENDFKKLF